MTLSVTIKNTFTTNIWVTVDNQAAVMLAPGESQSFTSARSAPHITIRDHD